MAHTIHAYLCVCSIPPCIVDHRVAPAGTGPWKTLKSISTTMSLRTVISKSFPLRPSPLALLKKACAPQTAFYSTKIATTPRPTGLFLARCQQVERPHQHQVRFGSSGSLGKDDIQRRILEVLATFEKCDPAKVRPSSYSYLPPSTMLLASIGLSESGFS